ncbi:MAG TPA: POTRA domain-containing protein [Vicinamibacteria bacterium]|nr:POTRA domain-containing protein [Vicinamibacteria bacterium]
MASFTAARAAGRACAIALVVAQVRAAPAQECPTVLAELGDPSLPRGGGGDAGGPRVEAVEFVGNRALGDGRLARRMEIKPHRFWRRRGGNAFSAARWRADHRRLCDLHREHGFVTAAVGPPEVTPAGEGSVRLRVPVREGARYRMGTLAVEGTTALEAAEARALFDVDRGGRYAHRAIGEGYRRLRRWYGRRGFAAWSATTTLEPRKGTGEVDVTLSVQEGPRAFVGRIELSGNTRTRDSLLRRRVPLAEGELLDTEMVREAVQAIEALGTVHVRAVTLDPRPATPSVVDVRFELEERRRLRLGLSGGANALEGVSLTGTVGAVNALGRAEHALVSAELGTAVDSVALSAGAPHAFGSAWAVAARGRSERLELEGVDAAGLPTRVRTEERLEVGGERPLGPRSALALFYSLARVSLRSTREPAPPTRFGRRSDSRLALSAFRDGWDHPWKPRRGLRASGAVRLSGGPLGGSTGVAEGRARAFAFAPLGRRAALGASLQAAGLAEFGAAELRLDERYLLGGDWQLRGFDARTVGPLDEAGRLVGGTRSVVLQAEAHVDLTSWLRALVFVDAGRAWAEGVSAPGGGASLGLELRLPLPLVGLPLRLIGATNLAREPFHPRHAFRIAVGPLP